EHLTQNTTPSPGPSSDGSVVAGTRVVVDSSPRTTVTPASLILSTSGRATSSNTTSCPPPARRAPKIDPIAPAPTTAIFILLLSSAVRVEPAAARAGAAIDEECLAGQERTGVGGQQEAGAHELRRMT